MFESMSDYFNYFFTLLCFAPIMFVIYVVFSELFSKINILFKRHKYGFKVYPVYLTKDEIFSLKSLIVLSGNMNFSHIQDKLNDVLLENGFSPHLFEYVSKNRSSRSSKEDE